MNILLSIGILFLLGYTMGWLLGKLGMPKIIGYILTGVALSPNSFDFFDSNISHQMEPLLDVCLAFIAFEVGGALKWETIRERKGQILSITFFASILPFIFISVAVFAFGSLLPGTREFTTIELAMIALFLGALASPTAPATTLAVIRQFHAKGSVTSTILWVAAIDDVFGIILFSLTMAAISIFQPGLEGIFGNPMFDAVYQIGGAVLLGALIARTIDWISKKLEIRSDGQWIVFILSLIILCAGLAKLLLVDELLAYMTMGVVVVNRCKKQKEIFRILRRYTEDFVFLIFFLLSGLHLEIGALPEALVIIVIFVVLRTLGKYVGVFIGGKLVHADPKVQKYTAGGLLPQEGIVIGLVLSVYDRAAFEGISHLLLVVIMGATVIHELIGPIAARHALNAAGETHPDKD